MFDFERDHKVDAAYMRDDAAAGFEILEGLSFFLGEEIIAIYDHDDGIAKLNRVGDAA